jgi:hypothetical protein
MGMSNHDKTRKWKPKNGNRNQRMFNQLEGYRMEQILKQGNVAPNRNQLERTQLELIQLEHDQGRVFNTKGSPNRNNQPALVNIFMPGLILPQLSYYEKGITPSRDGCLMPLVRVLSKGTRF